MSSFDLNNNAIALEDQVTEPEEVSQDGRHVTEEEYWEKYYEDLDFNYEWNNGILEEKPMSDYHNYQMYKWLRSVLERYLSVHRGEKMVEQVFGFRIALPHHVSIRKPDLAVVASANPSDLRKYDKSFAGIYDLCIELLSDATKKGIERDIVDKKNEYESIGVKEYYILDAEDNYMAFYRLNQYGIFVPIKLIDNDIVRSEVLKGFQFRVSDLFRQPEIDELTDDTVYCGFVLPDRKTKQRAEKAEKKAEAERQRAEDAEKLAEQEKQRADRLAEKLRALGISVD